MKLQRACGGLGLQAGSGRVLDISAPADVFSVRSELQGSVGASSHRSERHHMSELRKSHKHMNCVI